MRLFLLASILLAATTGSVAAQATAGPRQFVSKVCGFKATVPADWKIKPSASKKCVFTVVAPHRADGDLEVVVRKGTLEQGADDLGFSNEGGKWTLQGEDSVAAEQIESPTWTGLQGSVATRIYEKGFYAGLGDQSRALLFNRKNRIAEVTCYVGEKVVSEFVQGFEFLGESSP